MRNQRKAGVKGITLIALVITIVILIILAVISMNAIFGEKGIISRVKDAASKDAAGRVEEEMKLKMLDVVLSGYTGNFEEVLETLKDFGVKGLYRINLNIEANETMGNITGEADGIIESNGKLYRCILIINANTKQENLDFDIQVSDAEEITSIEDKAKAFFKALGGQEDPDLETLDTGIIKYKEKLYQIIMNQMSETQVEIYIEEFDIFNTDDKIWKKAYTTYYNAIATDSENNIWIWTKRKNISTDNINSITPVCINKFNHVEMIDKISYDNGDDVQGFVGSDGKIYMLNTIESNIGINYDIECLTDKFQSELGYILVKQAYIDNKWINESGIDVYEIHLVDQNNKIWILGFDEEYNTLHYKVCLNDDVSSMAGIQVETLKMTYNNQYFIDTNKKIWRISISSSQVPTANNVNVVCLSDDSTLSLYGKRIKEIYTEGGIQIIDEEGVLYEYNEYNNTVERFIDKEGMQNVRIEKYIPYLIIDDGYTWELCLDTDGNLREIDDGHLINTNGVFNNNRIKDACGIIAIDEYDNIWYSNFIIGNLQGRTIKEFSADYVFLIIDNDGKLYKGGNFVTLA